MSFSPGSRVGGKIQVILCLKKTPTKERTLINTFLLSLSSLIGLKPKPN
jgi:hypothetical protein